MWSAELRGGISPLNDLKNKIKKGTGDGNRDVVKGRSAGLVNQGKD